MRPTTIISEDLRVAFVRLWAAIQLTFYPPPYLLHVLEMRVCGQRLWETHEVLTPHEVLTHKASTDACDATCTSRNYEVKMCVKANLKKINSDDYTCIFLHLKNNHTDT